MNELASKRDHSGSRVKHLNPRQGITTVLRGLFEAGTAARVKHLNPRQGITTKPLLIDTLALALERVKHLNPRQGITTAKRRSRC